MLKYSDLIVLSAVVELAEGNRDELRIERQRLLDLRRSKHPDLTEDCCAGSFFRNIEPTSKADRRQAAGYFLEQAGAKEMSVGGAGLYHKHANIIIKSDQDCKAQDVYDLSKNMQKAVKDMFDIDLRREVRLIGYFDDFDGVR